MVIIYYATCVKGKQQKTTTQQIKLLRKDKHEKVAYQDNRDHNLNLIVV